jgi:hypothetical protein
MHSQLSHVTCIIRYLNFGLPELGWRFAYRCRVDYLKHKIKLKAIDNFLTSNTSTTAPRHIATQTWLIMIEDLAEEAAATITANGDTEVSNCCLSGSSLG